MDFDPYFGRIFWPKLFLVIFIFIVFFVINFEHVFERWNLFPHERSKIIKILNSVETKSLIISGDRHKGGLYKKESLVELTSSSLNKPVKAARISNILRYVPEFIVNFIPKSTRELLVENDKLLTTEIYNFENFGLIKINTESEEVEISLNDINGNNIFADKIWSNYFCLTSAYTSLVPSLYRIKTS